MAPSTARGTRLAIAATVVACALALRWWQPHPATPATSTATAAQAARYVGAAACAGCHAAETVAWQQSRHAHAMQIAAAGSMLGRFDGAALTNLPATFSHDSSGYFVHTAGADGEPAGFPLAYSFGVYPLQQYLVPLSDGRLQALPYAWDARTAAQGGQRWFDLQAGDEAPAGSSRHWTSRDQNWNYLCADCHSTNLRRNYDAAQDRYASSWTDLAVGCEACHGPGSRHLAWARHDAGTDAKDQGLTLALDERHGVAWTTDAASGDPVRSASLSTHREVETCAACHSRRRPLGDDPTPTGQLLDNYEPALLDAGLYYPDGQQQGEVYIYGSYLQSRMYAAGVSCSDCHEPHGGRLRAEGNALCTQCHQAARYDSPGHHLHQTGSAGAQCVACHMPARTYMQVDLRRDHSMRVPRPDLSLQYGVPNACNGCHGNKDARWAAAAIEKAHGPQRKGYQNYVDVLSAARSGAPGALDKLLILSGAADAPGIARATAVAALGHHPGARGFAALRTAAQSGDPLIRDAALDAVLSYPPQQRAELALPLADDPRRAVRVKAGQALLGVPDALLDPGQRQVRDRAYAEWRASELAAAERPESRLNLGAAAAARGEAQEARAQYRAALKLDPRFTPAYANLAELERDRGDETQAAAVLDEGLRAVPGDPALLHLRGLQQVRAHHLTEAIDLLGQAARAAPEEPRYAYVYAVALHSAGQPAAAVSVLERALRRSPYSTDLLSAAVSFEREAGHTAGADAYSRRLDALRE